MALAFDLTLACSKWPLTSQKTLLVTPRAVSHLIHNAQTTRDIQSQNITHQKWPGCLRDIKWLHFRTMHCTFWGHVDGMSLTNSCRCFGFVCLWIWWIIIYFCVFPFCSPPGLVCMKSSTSVVELVMLLCSQVSCLSFSLFFILPILFSSYMTHWLLLMVTVSFLNICLDDRKQYTNMTLSINTFISQSQPQVKCIKLACEINIPL